MIVKPNLIATSAPEEAGNGTRNCPACNSSRAKPIGVKGGFDLSLCRACGTLYDSILPTSDREMPYDFYYIEETPVVPEFIDKRLEEIVNSFAPYRLTNRLVDIGCGAGSFLMTAKRANWDAEGVEVSPATVERLRSSGLEVFSGELGQAAFPTAHFDVVTASELIEHVHDPSSLIAEIARVLRPGGLFWATTPNARGASARILKLNWSIISPAEHLHLFSIRGLIKLLSRHGFSRVHVKSEGLHLPELLGGFRKRERTGVAAHNRVDSNYRLNEELLRNPRRRVLRNAANAILRASRLGDSLKIWAER
jgi:2-polyprenyl-3-methyl-5-hydroxy-6-metoxy-1,4-benzoquinol methylase